MAPMEVDPDWLPLPLPGEHNQLNATMPRLPMIPRHQALDEHDTTYPMLPKGFHCSQVDNTVRAGAAAKAAQWNEALGVVPPHNTMRPSDCGFPQTVADWEGLFRSTCRKDNNKALHMAQAFATQAQNMLAVQWTEPQHQALKEWTYPDWFTPAPRKGKACAAPKKSERPLATSSGLWRTAQPISPHQVPLSRNSRCSRSCPRCTLTAGSRAIRRMCGSICPHYGTPPKCGPCGLTRTRTTVRGVLWSCLTAAYQCAAYEGCS